MVNLLDMLPLLGGWSFVRVESDREVEAGDDVTLYDSPGNEQGWLLGATFSSDVSDAGLSIEYSTAQTGQTITFDLNPKALYDAHRISPNDVSPYVAVYDDTNSVYEAVFSPRVPFPFNGSLLVKLNGGSSDGTLNADLQMVVITDEDTFNSGLMSLLGVNNIQSYLYSALQQLAQLGNRPIKVELPTPPVPAPPARPREDYNGFWP